MGVPGRRCHSLLIKQVAQERNHRNEDNSIQGTHGTRCLCGAGNGLWTARCRRVSRQEAADAVNAYNEGTLLIQKSEFGEAAEKLLLATQKNPNVAEAHIFLGFAYANAGEFDEAEASLKKGEDAINRTNRALGPSDSPDKIRAMVHSGRAELAIKRAKAANQKDPSDRKTIDAYMATAKAELETALSIDPSSSYANKVLAAINR